MLDSDKNIDGGIVVSDYVSKNEVETRIALIFIDRIKYLPRYLIYINVMVTLNEK